MFVFVLTCLAITVSASNNYLVADMYSSAASCSSGGIIQASGILEVGSCVDLPGGLPPPLDKAASYQISSCVNGAADVEVEIDGYTSAGCTGVKIPIPFNKIPVGCYDSSMVSVSCQSAPIAHTERWPAVGLYLDDVNCKTPIGYIATKPGCDSFTSDIGDFSGSMACPSAIEMRIAAYNNSATCASGTVVVDYSFPSDVCTLLSDIPVTDALPAAAQSIMKGTPLGDVALSGYYMGSCTGF